MFRGTFEHTIDKKGRISIPVKFREVLQKRYPGSLMVTNFDGCLAAYPLEEWEEIEEKQRRLPNARKEVRLWKRFFYAAVQECLIDRQGRILIPPTLRESAGLQKEVIFAGMYTYFEIWDKKSWQQVVKQAEEEFESVSGIIAEMGL